MSYYPKLIGEKCYLSPCQVEDASAWATWFNDISISIPLGDEAYTTLGLDALREDAISIIKEHKPVFSIIELENNHLIGRCLLANVDHINRSAMLGIVIGEKEFWGKGYGFEASHLLLDFGFNLLNLNSVMLGVYSFNERAIRTYQKLGFREMGRQRQARIIGGQKFDVILMDLLAEEFTGSQICPIPQF